MLIWLILLFRHPLCCLFHFWGALTFNGAFFIAGRLSLHIKYFFLSVWSTILQPSKRNEQEVFYLDRIGKFRPGFIRQTPAECLSSPLRCSWPRMPGLTSADLWSWISQWRRPWDNRPCWGRPCIVWKTCRNCRKPRLIWLLTHAALARTFSLRTSGSSAFSRFHSNTEK